MIEVKRDGREGLLLNLFVPSHGSLSGAIRCFEVPDRRKTYGLIYLNIAVLILALLARAGGPSARAMLLGLLTSHTVMAFAMFSGMTRRMMLPGDGVPELRRPRAHVEVAYDLVIFNFFFIFSGLGDVSEGLARSLWNAAAFLMIPLIVAPYFHRPARRS